MKARVFIRLKSEVLDPQGQAIESSLKNLNENNIKNIRQGKLIEMDIEAKNLEEARKYWKYYVKTSSKYGDWRLQNRNRIKWKSRSYVSQGQIVK